MADGWVKENFTENITFEPMLERLLGIHQGKTKKCLSEAGGLRGMFEEQ